MLRVSNAANSAVHRGRRGSVQKATVAHFAGRARRSTTSSQAACARSATGLSGNNGYHSVSSSSPWRGSSLTYLCTPMLMTSAISALGPQAPSEVDACIGCGALFVHTLPSVARSSTRVSASSLQCSRFSRSWAWRTISSTHHISNFIDSPAPAFLSFSFFQPTLEPAAQSCFPVRRYPILYKDFMRWLGLINLDIVALSPIECTVRLGWSLPGGVLICT